MTGAFLNQIKQRLDGPTLKLMSLPWAGKIADYLSYQRQRARRRQTEARLRAAGQYGDTVQFGPFRGLQYPPESWYVSCRFQKVIGSYEHELHALLTLLIREGGYRHIVNIGAADGYFAAGLARALPESRGVAFEMSESSRRVLAEVVARNGLQPRLRLEGACSPADLQALERELEPRRTLVVCDVDGYEVELLAEGGVGWLAQADLLVEVHDCLRPGVTERLIQAFGRTHGVTKITNRGVTYADYPLLRPLTFREIDALLNEDRRGLQDWLFLTPDASRHARVTGLGSHQAPAEGGALGAVEPVQVQA